MDCEPTIALKIVLVLATIVSMGIGVEIGIRTERRRIMLRLLEWIERNK